MEKTPEDVLQQELLRERAEVLGRAGESVERALIKLRHLGESIEGQCRECLSLQDGHHRREAGDLPVLQKQILRDINKNITQYNRLREYARLRYHYLIITREAMGLRRHQWVEEVYPIPPKKKPIQET